jgi:hypothetical protein
MFYVHIFSHSANFPLENQNEKLTRREPWSLS